MIAEKNKEFGFINIYSGKTSTLSSCCFDGEEVIEVTNKVTGMTEVMAIKVFVEKYISADGAERIDTDYSIKSINPQTFEIEDADIIGVLRKDNEYQELIVFKTDSGDIKVTPDHIFFVKDIITDTVVEITAHDISKDTERYLLPIIVEDMQFIKINGITRETKTSKVYDIELEKNHYFAANNIVSHNCRLRSETENEYFNSFGSGSSKIGSLGVCTINFPRLAWKSEGNVEKFLASIEELVQDSQDINNAKRHIVQKRIDNGNHPLYSLGFMALSKQYSTVGVNGLYEAVQIMGHDIMTKEGQEFTLRILDVLNKKNDKIQKKYNAPHNVEQIPAENVAIKLAEKDKLLGYNNGVYDLYSNQFVPLVVKADLLDRIEIQGMFDSHFSGGAIAHLNVETRIDDTTVIANLIRLAAKKGCIYFAINFVLNECEEGHMTVGMSTSCTTCGSKIIGQYTRVVGFLAKVDSWHKIRREKDFPNRVFEHKEPLEEAMKTVEYAVM